MNGLKQKWSSSHYGELCFYKYMYINKSISSLEILMFICHLSLIMVGFDGWHSTPCVTILLYNVRNFIWTYNAFGDITLLMIY